MKAWAVVDEKGKILEGLVDASGYRSSDVLPIFKTRELAKSEALNDGEKVKRVEITIL